MLSYRHAFHAGNHADLLKHSCLTLILSSLLKKDKAFTVFDTHGGGGLYQLDYQGLVHTGEAEKGILKLLEFAKQHPLPDSLQTYLELVKKYLDKGMYPGSPEISKAMMRQQDKLFVAELHNTEIEILRGNLSILDKEKNQTPSISIHHESGFSLLKSSLPPLVKRGLILMDPSYETDSDYQQPIQALSQAAKKWETAIIALWYPLLLHRSQQLDNM
ncbi:MAG: 23S rRNA (adenine(2030)-N(6))-methyltransferase RlmJ, partial [Spirochaetaceae bacterium]|nr:23S rRNA (adenine(2030)-N(6))-methyltransferase RlmJ [Spirochaetaceae bacterium]